MAIGVLGELKQNVSATLGGVALDVTRSEYGFYRGGAPVPQIIPIGAARVEEFAKLGVGPHVLAVEAPSASGANVGTVKTDVQGVYLDYIEATTATEGFLRLYDVRWLLSRHIVARDFNVARPDDVDVVEAVQKVGKIYKDDTAASQTAPATLGFALDKLRADADALGVKFDYEYRAAQTNEDLPDDVFLAGYYRFNEAIAYLCDLMGCDIGVTKDGKVRVIDRSQSGTLSDGYNWHIEPPFNVKDKRELAAPETINVFCNQRWELELDLPVEGTASPSFRFAGLPNVVLRQVYNVGNKYYSSGQLLRYFYEFLQSNPSTQAAARVSTVANIATLYQPGYDQQSDQRIRDGWMTPIDENIGNDKWEGTVLQTVPQEGGDALAEGLAAMAAKSIVDIIKRDHRHLYAVVDANLSPSARQVLDSWNDFQFGVTDRFGQVKDFIDEGNGSRRGAVTGDWCELYSFPIHLQTAGPAAIDGELGANYPEGQNVYQPAPFVAKWESEQHFVLRLEPLTPLENSPLHGNVANRWLGQWAQVPRIRGVVQGDLLASDLGQDVRTIFSSGAAQLSTSINARVTMVATQRWPNDRSRFYIRSFQTNIKDAKGSVDLAASPDVYVVYDRNGNALNRDVVDLDADKQAQRVADAYKNGATGVGIAHGTKLLNDLGGPTAGVQSLSIMFGNGAWPYFIGTMVTYAPPSEGDLLKRQRKIALLADREGRKR